MSQLLIIDVQNIYRKHFEKGMLEGIRDLAKQSGEVYFLYDNTSGEQISDEVPQEWIDDDSDEENSYAFYDSLRILDKNYGFFRSLMALGLDAEDEELVKLAKFMIKRNIGDAREIASNTAFSKDLKKEFKGSPVLDLNFDDYTFWIPYELIDQLENSLRSGVVLVGGGRNECLKEVSLLLKAIEIDHTIREDLTY